MGRKREEYIAGSLDDIKHVWKSRYSAAVL